MTFQLLLIAPPVLHGHGWWSNREAGKPHLDSLAGFVSDLCGVAQLELDRGGDLDEALSRLDEALQDDTRLVGISCWTSLHYLGTVAIIEHLRRVRPELPIVVGGHHATGMPSDFEGLADWVVTGDGEHPLRSLCADPPRRPPRTIVLAGNPLALGGHDHIDWPNYGRSDHGGAVWIALSRGCPYRCRFCIEPLRGSRTSRYSVADALRIIETVYRARSPRSIAFADPLFGAHRSWTEELLAGLEELGLPVQYWAETRADLMTPALLARFRRCNFKLDFGLDTGSETMAGLMEKAPDPARYLRKSAEMLRAADAEDLHHGVYLLFNYPGETPETAAETRAYVQDLMPRGGPASGWLSAQTFFVLPGTESYRRLPEYARRFGTRVDHPTWWREVGDHHQLATAMLPHEAWVGREAELAGFNRWQRGVNARWTARWSPEVRRFSAAFYGSDEPA